MLDTIASYNCRQFQGKLRIQTQENGEKRHYGPNLGLLDTNSGRENFGSKIWLRHSLDIMVSIIMHNQKKTNDLVLRKISDVRTDKSDFIGRCPTNVERRIYSSGHSSIKRKYQIPFLEEHYVYDGQALLFLHS